MTNATNNKPTEQHGHPGGVVLVQVQTTAGGFPTDGFDKVPAVEKVALVLSRAASALGLVDTAGWVALVGSDRIDPERSFADLGLHGKVCLNWGPEHGGGG